MTLKERDEVIKALECCKTESTVECLNCPYRAFMNCESLVRNDALSLIKELTEELEKERVWANSMIDNLRDDIGELSNKNEMLKDRYRILDSSYEKLLSENGELGAELLLSRWNWANIKLDTIHKMQSMIKEECIAGGIYPAFVARVVENVGKKLLEDAV